MFYMLEEVGGLFFTRACRGVSAAIFRVPAKNPSEKKNGVFSSLDTYPASLLG